MKVISLIQQLPTCFCQLSKERVKSWFLPSYLHIFYLSFLIDRTHPIPLSPWPGEHTRPQPLAKPLPSPPPALPPPSSCLGVWLVGGFIDQRVLVSPGLLHPEQQGIRPLHPCRQSQSESPPCASSHTRASSYLLSLHASPIIHPPTQEKHPGSFEPFKLCENDCVLFLVFFFSFWQVSKRIQSLSIDTVELLFPQRTREDAGRTTVTLPTVRSPPSPVGETSSSNLKTITVRWIHTCVHFPWINKVRLVLILKNHNVPLQENKKTFIDMPVGTSALGLAKLQTIVWFEK